MTGVVSVVEAGAERRDAYRLLVAMEGQDVFADGPCYGRFDQAQARVARTVARHARAGRVTSILLQHGIPRESFDARRFGEAALSRSASDEADYDWIVEKCWGEEVVSRILRQQSAPARGVARSPLFATDLGARARRCVCRHRNHRWHILGAAALMVFMILTVLMIQTEGRPETLLTTFDDGSVKSELPFDARRDFVNLDDAFESRPLTRLREREFAPARRAIISPATPTRVSVTP